jgi:hypothetical protein
MRTVLDLAPDLLGAAERCAAEDGLTLDAFVEQGLTLRLAQAKSVREAARRGGGEVSGEREREAAFDALEGRR